MYFRILGPLEASQCSAPITLGGPRQQTVLAMLLLNAEHLVPVYQLIDAVWQDDPPQTAREQIHICISSLRRALGPAGGAGLISTRSPGYLLRLAGHSLDAQIFEAQAQEGRALLASDPVAAVGRLRSAVSLWQGEALSGISSPLVQSSATHLNERRLSVLEECIEIELKANLNLDPVSELRTLTRENPLREHFSALLMTALCQNGRQAEALETYHDARSALMDQLGIEPGAELRQLQQMILAEKAITEPVSQPSKTAGRQPAQEPTHDARPFPVQGPRVTPMLLPPTIPDLTGRSEFINQVIAGMNEPDGATLSPPVTVFHGPGGVGKTAVAIQLAHRLAAWFPDGQLFARLRSGSRPVGASDVLRRFLHALGGSGLSVPASGEERAEIYRNLLAKRRILIVLDDAASEEQVAPLLPGTAQCSVLLTSRMRLTGLPAVGRIEIGPLSRRSAVALLGQIVGTNRIEGQPEAAAALCELCGDLPLALRIVAARLAARPHWSITALLHRLTDESRRLDELNYGSMGVRASIALSHDGLSAQARRLFRLLALFEQPSFSSSTGSLLMQIDRLQAEDLLEELTEGYLLSAERQPQLEMVRYRFRDLVRPFARECLFKLESPDERQVIRQRVMSSLVARARRAAWVG